MDYPETVSGEWRAVVVKIPIKILSEANTRDHWAVKYRRTKRQKHLAGVSMRAAIGAKPMKGPVIVTLTRLIGSGGRVLDDDNLAGGFKAIRDAVASSLGIDDGDTRAAVWRYEQRKAGEWGCEVRIAQDVKPS